MSLRLVVLSFCSLLSFFAVGQVDSSLILRLDGEEEFEFTSTNDSDYVFTREEFLQIVLANHPVAQQAKYLSEQGQATLQASRGAFDPEIFGNYDSKQFQGKDYYEYGSIGLTVPTWFGVEVNTGWDFSDKDAIYANPEKTTPAGGTGYLGISVPLGQDMIIDERRKALRQGEVARDASEAGMIQMINQLLYDANVQYWKWVESYQNMEIYEASIINAETRFSAVKNQFLLGESAAIDTLEALSQIQAIQYNYFEAKVSQINERLYLSNYLWTEDSYPLQIGDTIQPQRVEILDNVDEAGVMQIMSEIDSLLLSHPTIQLYQYKLQSLVLEQRFKSNKLLPKGKLKYNLLTEGYGLDYSTEDYKWGVYLSFPIAIRQQRGENKLYKLKVLDTQSKLSAKQYELQNKLAASNAKLKAIMEQVRIYQNAVQNYSLLLRSEEIKVLNGESSLFKVNERELKYFKAQVKLNNLISKFYQTKSMLVFAAGMGADFYQVEIQE